MRPATLADLCASHGIPVPPIRGFHDFAGFGEIVGGALEAMRAAEDFERLVDEVVEDQARDGVTYVEPAFWPYRYAHLFAGHDAVGEIVLAAGAAAAERHGVVVRWIAAIDRVHDSPEQAMKVVELARRYRDQGIVAVGLHNDENGYPPEPFAPAFRAALDAGLRSTPHAGELARPASV